MHVPWRCLFYVLKQKKKAWKLGLCHCTDQASLKESFVFPVVCTLPILFMLWLTNTYIPTCVLCFLVNLTVTPPNFLWVMSGWLVHFWAPQLLTATTPNSFCWTPSGCLVLYFGSSTCLLAARAPPFFVFAFSGHCFICWCAVTIAVTVSQLPQYMTFCWAQVDGLYFLG